jgi:hypothetical protein
MTRRHTSTPPLLTCTVDAEGALHVRRRWGSGVVVLNFNRDVEMSPLLRPGQNRADPVFVEDLNLEALR